MAPFPRRQPFRSLSPLNQIAFFQPPRYQEPASPSADLTSRCGMVAAVTLAAKHFSPDVLPDTIRVVQRLYDGLPRVALVAFVAEWPGSLDRGLLRGISSLPARTVLPGRPPPTLQELREAVTVRSGLFEAVHRWFRTHVRASTGELEHGLAILRAGLDASPTDRIPGSERSRRRSRGGSDRSWHMLGRGIKAALILQRHPEWNLTRTAHALEFHDGAGLSRHLARTFGRRPSFLRWRLSWEWLVHDWVSTNLGSGALSPTPILTPADLGVA